MTTLALLAASCSGTVSTAPDQSSIGSWKPVTTAENGLTGFARTAGDQLLIDTEAGERDFVAGVNLGPTVPGRQPGEQAIDRESFRRWFPQMRDMGLRAIRVYTIMPPAFYEELRSFNLENRDSPLLLIHGVWIPEERFYQTFDLFDAELVSEFESEIESAVDVVHGDAVLPDRPGHAWGTYDADVSPWLMSWAIGVEWDPFATEASDVANEGKPAYRGDYFESTADASATEVWLAEMLDHLAGLEAARGTTMPLTFVNWPTTDPLVHPSEPLEREDSVGVDHNHVRATSKWPGGYYASYHAYPYYPDFQRYEPGIAGYQLGGEENSYAGYLAKLKTHHAGMPVVITEFGVPSGMASAHFGPQGRNQGDHREQDQMRINADLLETIEKVGMSGGFVFEWADEWFKFTWNTIDYEIPSDRRSLWMNPWTNEANFGLVATDPGAVQSVLLDGDDGEWLDNGSQVIAESRGSLREVRALKDEAFLYLRIYTDEPEVWRETPVVIGFDVLDGDSGGLPGTDGAAPGADYAVVLDEDGGRMMVRASNDPYLIQYAWIRSYESVDPADLVEGSSVWNVHRLVVNRPLTVPTTGKELDAETISPGDMVHGSSDPSDTEFNSRSTWSANGHVIEVRVPYQAIGFSDPSSLQAYRIAPDGVVSTETVERIDITVVVGGDVFDTTGYAWEQWQSPDWHERAKAGSDVFSSTVVASNSP